MNWPKITLIFPTLNGGIGVKSCLESVKKQIYPKSRIEIIVADNGSKDNSVNIARKYTKNVFISYKMGYEPRAEAMRMATGEYVYMILEQDMELKNIYFLQKMVKPLLLDNSLVASFTREYPRKDQPWVTRFISYDPIQRDPLLEFLSPSIESTIIEEKLDYKVCKYLPGKIPPTTHMLFRKKYLKKTNVWNQTKDFDHDTVVSLVTSGYNRFAYVPDAGIYHHHAKNLIQLINKRKRNLNNHYFPYNSTLNYRWINVSDKNSVLKITLWVLYANLIIPAFIRGIYRALKNKDLVLLMEPVITIAVTDAVLWEFVKSNTGRKMMINSFKTIIAKR